MRWPSEDDARLLVLLLMLLVLPLVLPSSGAFCKQRAARAMPRLQPEVHSWQVCMRAVHCQWQCRHVCADDGSDYHLPVHPRVGHVRASRSLDW